MLATALCLGVGTVTAASASAAGASGTTASAVHADDTSTTALDDVTFTSVSNGRDLDVQNGTTGAGPIVVTNSAPGYDESWHIGVGATDQAFTIVNNTTGECIDAGTPLRVQACDGRTTEQWYFEPVHGSSQDAFMIRQAGGSNCLDLLLGAQYDDAWTDSYGCNDTAAQQWVLPTGAYQAAWNMAVDYAATQCENDTATCSWTTGTQSTPAALPLSCVSPVWYNDTSAPVTWTFNLSTTTGWSDTVGYTLTTKLSAGVDKVLQSEVDTAINASYTNNLSETLGNSVAIPVPANDYAWVALSELATEVTGNWTFDTQGFAWTAQDTVTVPLTTDQTGASSYYIARTASAFTSCAN